MILDPFAAFLGKIDSHRNSDVRALLTPLSKLAAKRQVAIVGINHLNKGDGDHAMYRGIGSIAFVACTGLVDGDGRRQRKGPAVVHQDQVQPANRRVGGLAHRIGPHVPGVILWEQDPIFTTANKALRAPTKTTSPGPSRGQRLAQRATGKRPGFRR